MMRRVLGTKLKILVETHQNFDFDWDDNLVGEHCRAINEKLSLLQAKYKLERWDGICLERVFTWAGHVARFGKYGQDRIAWKVLNFRGIAYLRQLEKSYGQQCHGKCFHMWRYEHQFSTFFGDDWQKLAMDQEQWADLKEFWLESSTSECGSSTPRLACTLVQQTLGYAVSRSTIVVGQAQWSATLLARVCARGGVRYVSPSPRRC